jgi:hypothetical protein
MLSMNAAGKIPSVIFNERFSLVIDSHISGNWWILTLHIQLLLALGYQVFACCVGSFVYWKSSLRRKSAAWFGYIVRLYFSGEEGGILLVQIISTCLRCPYRKGGGGQHPWFTQANLVVAREQTLFNQATE